MLKLLLKIDRYSLAILASVVVASLLPASGIFALWLGWIVKAAIALLDPPPAARQDPQNQFLSRLIDTWERASPETRQQFVEYAGLLDAPEGDEA